MEFRDCWIHPALFCIWRDAATLWVVVQASQWRCACGFCFDLHPRLWVSKVHRKPHLRFTLLARRVGQLWEFGRVRITWVALHKAFCYRLVIGVAIIIIIVVIIVMIHDSSNCNDSSLPMYGNFHMSLKEQKGLAAVGPVKLHRLAKLHSERLCRIF